MRKHPKTAMILALLAGSILTGCGPLIVGGIATGAAVAHDRRSAGTVIDDQNLELSAYRDFNQYPVLKDRSHISVAVYNGAALLTGEVPEQEAGELAERVVQSLEGVRVVHNELIVAQVSPLSSRTNDALISTRVKASLLKVDRPGFDPTRVKVTTERGIVYLMGLLYPGEAEPVIEAVRQINGVQQVVTLFEHLENPA